MRPVACIRAPTERRGRLRASHRRSVGLGSPDGSPAIVRRKGQYVHIPLRTVGVARVRISVGKLRGLQQISDNTGRFTMIAMDQRGSLQKMLHPENPKAATYGEMEAVKLGVTEALAPHASGYLLDPEYGVGPAINRFALPGRTGLLVSLETSGYEKKGNWRLTTLLEGWNVEKVKRLGASAAKLLIFFNPDAPREIVDHQSKVVQGVADECRRLDLAFVCEPMSYPVDESDESFAHHKADTIIRTAEALSPLGLDVLKAEFPGDPKVTTNPEELRKNCERLSRATKVPWVVLSAGADFPVFRGLVETACRGGASGFLAGRAIWKDAFREKTLESQMAYVRTQGVKNFQDLADLAHRYARPWWDFYGGKEKLQDHFEGWYDKY
jgi:tagatose 1,6-diphosphate aldolase